MNDWKPITRVEFDDILKDEIELLPPREADAFSRLRVAPTLHGCFRSEMYGGEQVFLVARSGPHILFYDDVENEFAVGMPDADGILRHWGLCGALSRAVGILVGSSKTPVT